jgi:hypothetical protein
MPAVNATQFGTNVNWGINAAETGFIINSYTHKYSNEKETIPGRFGSTETVIYFNETVSISMDGEIPASSPFSGTLAATLTLGNPLSSYLKGSITTGQTITESIEVTADRKGAKKFKLEAMYYPF